jgi:CheY-like chemotaxis protein
VTRPNPPLRTLIADESQAFSAVLRRWLDGRTEFVWIATVRTGPEAIEAARRLLPDLVLLDAVLPTIDGFRVVRELAGLLRPPLTVIVTFQAGEHARRAAMNAGADGFLAKEDFAAGMDLLLPRLLDRAAAWPADPEPVSPQARSGRPGSRTGREP